MKKLYVYMATGLFLACAIGTAQAANYNAREDCCTEGPPYNRNIQQGPAIPTIVIVDQGPLYIEGMGFAPRPIEVKTVVPNVAASRDWCCEDMSKAEEEMHFKRANEMEPAAGF